MKELYLANPIIDIDIKDIPNIYFTSDLHFNHNNIIKYSHRPFKDAEEMNTILLNNLNEELSKSVNPILFNAGDFMFGKVSMYEDLMEQRNISRGIALKMIYTDGYQIHSTGNCSHMHGYQPGQLAYRCHTCNTA